MKPIRCYTCGKVLGNKWEIIEKLLREGRKLSEVYNMLMIRRYCCKRIVMTSVDMMDDTEYDGTDKIKIHDVDMQENFLKIE